MLTIRMSLGWLALLWVVATLVVSLPVRAADDVDWEVSKTPDHCTLHRTIVGLEPAQISITTDPGSYIYALVITARKLPGYANTVFPATLLFHGPETLLTRQAMGGKLGASEAIQIDFPQADFAVFTKSTALSLTMGSKSIGPLPLPSAADALAALDACTAELLVAMGADPKQFQPGGATPVALADRDSWIDERRTADIARTSSHGVDTRFKLDIDTQGHVSSCSMFGGGGNAAAEKLACDALIGKALFRPAHDAAGNPVHGVATFGVNVRIERRYFP
jgi:hypothetical protein